MVASLLSLAYSGRENELLNSACHTDGILKGQPNVSYFIKVIRKSTRYGRQPVRLDFSNTPNFGTTATFSLPVKGELVHRLWLVVNLPDIYGPQLAAILATGGTNVANPGTTYRGPYFSWTNCIGYALVQSVTLEIGGAIVDTIDSLALELHDELEMTLEDSIRLSPYIGRVANGYSETGLMRPPPLVIPLPFWFTKHIQDALPVDAMSADMVRVHVTFRPLAQCYYTTSRVPNMLQLPSWVPPGAIAGAMWPLANASFFQTSVSGTSITGVRPAAFTGAIVSSPAMPSTAKLQLGDTYVIAEYIFVDRDEARALREAELTYNVKSRVRVYTGTPPAAATVKLPLRVVGMLQDLVWVCQNAGAAGYNAWFLFTRDLRSPATSAGTGIREVWWPDADPANNKPGFTTARSEPITWAKVKYKALDRFDLSPVTYRSYLPTQYYTKGALYDRYIYVAPVSVEPLARTVVGGANMDKIVDCELQLSMSRALDDTFPGMQVSVYATTVDVFKVYGGRGGMMW